MLSQHNQQQQRVGGANTQMVLRGFPGSCGDSQILCICLLVLCRAGSASGARSEDLQLLRGSDGGCFQEVARGQEALQGLPTQTPSALHCLPMCLAYVVQSLAKPGMPCSASSIPRSRLRAHPGSARAFPPFPCSVQISTIAGGAGAVFSTGLLRQLNPNLYESCIHGKEAASGGPTSVAGEIPAACRGACASVLCAPPWGCYPGSPCFIKLVRSSCHPQSLQGVMPF